MNIEQAIAELYSIRDFWLLPRHGDNGRAFEVRAAVDMAVDALKAPKVTHAHWIEHEDGYQTCSNCGEEHCWEDYRASYCDVCGAKMDEDSDSRPAKEARHDD